MRETIGSRFDQREGFGPGFDAMPVCLALGVLIWHEFAVVPATVWPDGTWILWFPGYTMLFMFFALSGILITGSAARLSLPNFLINRGLRIVPGAFHRSTSFRPCTWRYFYDSDDPRIFSNVQTFHYLTNIVGLMNFKLPGVFKSNTTDAVNLSLWTVPYEMVCYGIMSALIIFGIICAIPNLSLVPHWQYALLDSSCWRPDSSQFRHRIICPIRSPIFSSRIVDRAFSWHSCLASPFIFGVTAFHTARPCWQYASSSARVLRWQARQGG